MSDEPTISEFIDFLNNIPEAIRTVHINNGMSREEFQNKLEFAWGIALNFKLRQGIEDAEPQVRRNHLTVLQGGLANG